MVGRDSHLKGGPPGFLRPWCQLNLELTSAPRDGHGIQGRNPQIDVGGSPQDGKQHLVRERLKPEKIKRGGKNLSESLKHHKM